MQIGIKYSVLKEVIKTNKNIKDGVGWFALQDVEKDEHKDKIHIVDLTLMTKVNLENLLKQLTDLDIGHRTLITIKNWIENISDPINSEISNLKHLEKVFLQAIKGNNFKWIMHQNRDGYWIPKAVTNIEYQHKSRDDSEYVRIVLCSIVIKEKSRWDDGEKENKLETDDDSIYFWRNDLYEKEEDGVSVYDFEETEIEEEDVDVDDEESKKKIKKSRAKKGQIKFSTLLANKGFMLITSQHIEEYKIHMSLWNSLNKEVGKVYTATGMGYILDDTDKNYNYGRWGFMNEEDKISKLVIDPLKIKEKSQSKTNSALGTVHIPIEPYIFTYNLSQYCWANVHVASLNKYEFDKKCIDKLIISDAKKKLLSSLIGSKNRFTDIISGKSGGMIILGSGKPGLGKTLTAETYSELMELPLYSIQSSQLGIDVDSIEKNLNKVLYRADKWNAVLLIDEADCYVYKRGNDILQNCIVGTFLRVLEYYNGILFLTTNRGEIVDDAIMSRVTAHVKYEYPTKSETFKLWSVLSVNFDRKIDMKTTNSIWNKYEPICGRDIRNVLKMLSKYNPKQKEITLEMLEELKEFIPFLKHRGEAITEEE